MLALRKTDAKTGIFEDSLDVSEAEKAVAAKKLRTGADRAVRARVAPRTVPQQKGKAVRAPVARRRNVLQLEGG